MEDAVYDVATAAYDQLLTARSLLDQIPDAAFPALLSAVSNSIHAKKKIALFIYYYFRFLTSSI